MSWGAKLEDFDEKNGWDRLMALNVKSIFYLTTALIPLLEKDATNKSPAHVVNISSVAGHTYVAEMELAAEGNGTYSCIYYFDFQPSKMY